MAHKTLIGGTAYEISGGKTLIGGTAYSIKNGKTLVNGTVYEIGFNVTITIKGNSNNIYASVSINDEYVSDTELNVVSGTEITCFVRTYSDKRNAYILVNGEEVFSTDTSGEYEYIANKNATIHMYSTDDGESYNREHFGVITIVEEGNIEYVINTVYAYYPNVPKFLCAKEGTTFAEIYTVDAEGYVIYGSGYLKLDGNKVKGTDVIVANAWYYAYEN